LSTEFPTAVHALAELHDTPLSALVRAAFGLGVVWIDQLVPFQPSATVAALAASEPEDPTAVHALAELHDTPFITLNCAPFGLGVDWIDQLVPFQRSANVTAAPPLFVNSPTAVHSLAEVHATPFNPLSCAPLG